MSEKETPKSEVLYKKTDSSLDHHTEIVLSAESATDDGAWNLFKKLKEEMGVSQFNQKCDK